MTVSPNASQGTFTSAVMLTHMHTHTYTRGWLQSMTGCKQSPFSFFLHFCLTPIPSFCPAVFLRGVWGWWHRPLRSLELVEYWQLTVDSPSQKQHHTKINISHILQFSISFFFCFLCLLCFRKYHFLFFRELHPLDLVHPVSLDFLAQAWGWNCTLGS